MSEERPVTKKHTRPLDGARLQDNVRPADAARSVDGARPMDGTHNGELDQGTQPAGDALLLALREAFLSHAIDNRGRLNSARQAQAVSLALFALAREVLRGTAGEDQIREQAHALATEGLAMSTARAMLATLAAPDFLADLASSAGSDMDPAGDEPDSLPARFQHFSLQFMEHLANGREQYIHQAQEQSRVALQTALHLQLQQQRALRLEQEWRAEKLNEVLQLNSELARLKEEQNLLLNAVQRVRTLLELDYVAIYGWQRSEESWLLRAEAGAPFPAGHTSTAVDELLRQISTGRETAHSRPSDGPALRATRLSVGRFLLGVLLTARPAGVERDLDLLLNAFALSVSTNWRNVQLFNDSRQRTRELEILHGRYVDDIWQTPGAYLHAHHDQQTLNVERVPLEDGIPPGDGPALPLVMGDRQLGQIQLPAGTDLNTSDREFLEAIVHEMGSALYNARLIQATRSYSMQLQAAAEVSRTISTLLDEETLLAEVVSLIQRRFTLDRVALYLLEEDQAVLRATTGPAPAGDRFPLATNHLVARAMARARPAVSHPTPDIPTGCLALPLQARGAVTGALELYSRQGGSFSPEETAVLQSLAGQVAVAIDNASLFAQVQENYLRVNQLYQAGQQINAATRPAGVFQALVNYAAAGRQVDVAFVLSPDPHDPATLLTGNFWSRQGQALEPAQQHVPRTSFPAGDQLELSTLVDDTPSLDPTLRDGLAGLGVQAVALLPIVTEEQWSGSLVLGRMSNRPYSDSELQPFRNLCGQASVALANQLLLRETNALYFISQALNQALTADEALESTLEQIGLYTGISPCRLVLYDEEQQEGHITSVYAPQTGAPQTGATHQPDTTPAPAELTFPMNGDPLFEQLIQASGPLLLTREEAAGSARQYLARYALDATLLIPIRVQQRLAGFMALDSSSGTRPFTLSNRNFAQNAVGQLTIFLENISLFDETTQRAQDLIRLNQIGARLAGILELDQLLPVLHDELRSLLPVDIFLIAQYDHQAQRYAILHHVVDGQALPAGEARSLPAASPLPQLFAGQVPLHGETALELAATIPPRPLPANTLPPQSALWVGLHEENHPAGFIAIQSRQPAAYNDTAIQLFRSVATQASLALTNARLFRQTQENVAEFRTLFTVSQAATSSVEAAQRLDNMTRALHEGLQKASVIIYTLDPAGDHPLQVASTAGALLPAGPPPTAQSLSGQVLRLGQPLMVNDLRELPHLAPEIPGAAAQLSVPLNIGQRTIGVITAVSEKIGRFTDRDLRLLETLSISVAATLESTRLFENIQAANERLSELDRLKTRFLANMTHELRTPLNAIIGFSRVILKGIDGPITPEQEEDLNAIHRSGQHLLVLINDILDLAKIEAGKVVLVFEPVDLRELAEGALSTVRGLLADRPVTLELDVAPHLPAIEGDEIRLRQVMLNLLANAARYTDEGEIRCCITLEDEAHVLITVTDTGVGIAEQDFDRLFRAFEQADSTSRTGQGTGLGLPISQSLVEMHNGRIWFESEVGKGSTFYVRLPIQQPEGMG